MTAATFHAVCARLLREHAHLFGRTEQYTIYDQGDMRRVIDWILADKTRAAVQDALSECGQPTSAEVHAAMSLAKNQLRDPTSYRSASTDHAAPLVALVWQECEKELARSGAFDFDDLLVFAVRLLREHPRRLRWIRSRWRWLLVDEFQDVNRAQAELVSLLAGPEGNVAVVADDDQVVHRFRGADPGHIVRFAKQYPRHSAIVLAHNFRSRVEILDAATRCVAHNERRVQKTLMAVRGEGGRVEVRGFFEDWHEAHWVAGRVADAIADAVPGPEILILGRTGYATQAVQLALARAGIPHRVLGSLGLYERAEVKDALAYLNLLVNPADAQAFRRAIQSPRRGVGPATANQVVTRAREDTDGDVLLGCARAVELDAVRSSRARRHLVTFGDGLRRIRDQLRAGRSLGHLVVAAMMLEGGLVQHFEQRRDTSASWQRAETPSECSRICARSVAPRTVRGATRPGCVAPRLPQARGGPARRGARCRRGPARHRVDDSQVKRGRGKAGGRSRLRATAAPLLAVLGLARPGGPVRGAATVLRRRHPRQGHPDPDPRRHARRAGDLGAVAVPIRGGAARAIAPARRVNARSE